MEVKIVASVFFAIVAGVVSSVFGRPGPPENPPCQTKFTNDPTFFLLGTVIEAIYKSMEIVQPNESSKLGEKKCETYSAAETMFDGILAGVKITQDSNCLMISEVDEAEEATLLGSIKVLINIFFGIRMIDKNNLDAGEKINESENETNSEMMKALRSIFKGVKIVLNKTCPRNSLVDIENSLDPLNVIEQEATSAANKAVHTLFDQIVEIYYAVSEQQCDKANGKSNSSVIEFERDIANEAITQWVRDLFIVFRNSLSEVESCHLNN